jgi:hypothetical protein
MMWKSWVLGIILGICVCVRVSSARADGGEAAAPAFKDNAATVPATSGQGCVNCGPGYYAPRSGYAYYAAPAYTYGYAPPTYLGYAYPYPQTYFSPIYTWTYQQAIYPYWLSFPGTYGYGIGYPTYYSYGYYGALYYR